ncbi:pyridoxamine 5'-phosphate oxidase family protein [Pengzhenrongella frigida]|uniref:Pyridoxamine 5'-phosphate oxidase family protein n=1 Tax=Pengzhenrongella frigida TaxID=1259133 RepID=A0A4Q5N0Q1_9MICO|nr:pyridoxamine 5'-phosphate oxidase family protein [Cellulomonas sp. HLT2-17]RYV51648.1 pyridoxamine 5'-phosphate oxidase family protein [Cellulomonas sp. HLT2-17]
MQDERLTVIDPDECASLLRGSHLGRIALTDGDLPMILPVNFVVDDGDVVFRTSSGSLLAAAVAREPMAFEIDGIEARTRTGWSVLVRGHAQEVTDPAEVVRLEELELVPWAPGDRPHYIRVSAAQTSGRRITVPPVPSEYWG